MTSGRAFIQTAALVALLLVATADAEAATSECSSDETSMLQVNAQMHLSMPTNLQPTELADKVVYSACGYEDMLQNTTVLIKFSICSTWMGVDDGHMNVNAYWNKPGGGTNPNGGGRNPGSYASMDDSTWQFKPCGPSQPSPFNQGSGSFNGYQQYYINLVGTDTYLKCGGGSCSVDTLNTREVCNINDWQSFFLSDNMVSGGPCGLAQTAGKNNQGAYLGSHCGACQAETCCPCGDDNGAGTTGAHWGVEIFGPAMKNAPQSWVTGTSTQTVTLIAAE